MTKKIGYLMMFLPLLSIFLWAGFDFYGWINLSANTFNDFLRFFALILIHAGCCIYGLYLVEK